MIKLRYLSNGRQPTSWQKVAWSSLEKVKYYRLFEAKYKDVLIEETPNSLIFNNDMAEYWDDSTPYEKNIEELPDWLK